MWKIERERQKTRRPNHRWFLKSILCSKVKTTCTHNRHVSRNTQYKDHSWSQFYIWLPPFQSYRNACRAGLCVRACVCVHQRVFVQEQEMQMEGVEWRGGGRMVAAISVNCVSFQSWRPLVRSGGGSEGRRGGGGGGGDLYGKLIRRLRPFSNYTEIILIAGESSIALKFISPFLFACINFFVSHYLAPYGSPPPPPSWLASPHPLSSFPQNIFLYRCNCQPPSGAAGKWVCECLISVSVLCACTVVY